MDTRILANKYLSKKMNERVKKTFYVDFDAFSIGIILVFHSIITHSFEMKIFRREVKPPTS